MVAKAADKDFEVLVSENRFITDIQLVIERAMDAAGLSQADLARALDVSEANVSQMLSDTGRNFKARTIARIAHVLGLSPALDLVSKDVYSARRMSAKKTGERLQIQDSEMREWIRVIDACPTKQWETACNDDEHFLELEAA